MYNPSKQRSLIEKTYLFFFFLNYEIAQLLNLEIFHVNQTYDFQSMR